MTAPVPDPAATTRRCPFSPPTEYEQLRESGEIGTFALPSGRTAYLLTRASDVRAALTDERLSSSVNAPPPREGGGEVPGWFFGLDGSEHAAVRSVLTGHFTARAARDLAPAAERLVEEQLDTLATVGTEVDLVQDFCRPVARGLVRRVLGTGEADDAAVDDALETMESPEADDREWEEAVFAAWRASRLTVARDDLDRDGLIARLRADGRLTMEELATVSVSLRIGGGLPVIHFLAMALRLLLEREEVRRGVLQGDTRRAVHELLRYVPTNNLGVVRVAATAVEIGGSTVPEGTVVFASLPTANRDDDVVAAPEVLDLARPQGGHLTFGHGPHRCLGQHLAVVVAELALVRFAQRFPAACVAVPSDRLPAVDSATTHGVTGLPVLLHGPTPVGAPGHG